MCMPIIDSMFRAVPIVGLALCRTGVYTYVTQFNYCTGNHLLSKQCQFYQYPNQRKSHKSLTCWKMFINIGITEWKRKSMYRTTANKNSRDDTCLLFRENNKNSHRNSCISIRSVLQFKQQDTLYPVFPTFTFSFFLFRSKVNNVITCKVP